jgi:hypothetical protein
MSIEKPVLITAASLDEHAYGPVRQILESKGFPVIVYRTDKVLNGEEQFCLEINVNGELDISYNNASIAPEDISAAWCRKIGAFGFEDTDKDRAKHLYLTNEIRYLHETIWTLYDDDIWLNPPGKMRQADRRLWQLLVAHDLGFSIPKTVVSGDWLSIDSHLLSSHEQIIVKMIRGVISDRDQIKSLYTTPLNQAKIDEIRDHTTPFPGLYQPYIKKAREWRVTVVGENIFAAAIYTSENAKDDWRKLQATDAVHFVREDMPEGIDEKCIQFLGKMGLKFGAFDFIEKPDGEMIFLECNPNGQYGWLEDKLGLPVSQAIASELIKIATK